MYKRLNVTFQELTKKEAEYVSLSRDTTEADLKQRREIRQGTAYHIDQVGKVAFSLRVNTMGIGIAYIDLLVN